MFNLDETGCNIAHMCGRSLHKGIGSQKANSLLMEAPSTRDKPTKITLMPVVSEAGECYPFVLLLPGIQ